MYDVDTRCLVDNELRQPLAWPWYTVVGSATTFGIGWLASRLWPAPETPAAL